MIANPRICFPALVTALCLSACLPGEGPMFDSDSSDAGSSQSDSQTSDTQDGTTSQPTGDPTTGDPDTDDTGTTGESDSETDTASSSDTEGPQPVVCDYEAPEVLDNLDLPASPFAYANQPVPNYVNRDNTGDNPITNHGATLGRVLFYDTALSSNNTVACASCHQQAFAFGDNEQVSQGVNGSTGRHSMRLVNARFAQERRFFWDERADTLEEQTTQPIRDHAEMGYSGEQGDPSFDDLLAKLAATDYYPVLFACAFGDPEISEERMQQALAQFVRSIQSFDSKYDQGRSQVQNDGVDFPNFTAQENAGKDLWLAPPMFGPGGQRVGGGAGCQGCHRAPEFDIDPQAGNNGNVEIIGDTNIDVDVTRAPSLRDMFHSDGPPNGPLMHTGSDSFDDALDRYNNVQAVPGNNRLDPRLRPMGQPQQLNLTQQEREQLRAFVHTLSGTDIYSNPIWSDPFR